MTTNPFVAMMASKTTISGYSVIKGVNTSEEECYLLQFDGKSEPNPGESSGGAVLFSKDKKVVFEVGEYIRYATNNQAEYTGLIIGLKLANEMGIKSLLVEGDSKLVINQTAGSWKVKNEGMKKLHADAREVALKFDFIAVKHVFRDNNQHADRLTNEVTDTKMSFKRVFA
jgi:ribonuclease HI